MEEASAALLQQIQVNSKSTLKVESNPNPMQYSGGVSDHNILLVTKVRPKITDYSHEQ